MSEEPLVDVDPYDAALTKLLTTVPATWARCYLDGLDSAQQEALDRLVYVGLVEAVLNVEVTMWGFEHRLVMHFRVTGVWETALQWESRKWFPPEWPTGADCPKGQPTWSRSVFQEMRLTTNGQRAKVDLQRHRGRSDVFDFLATNTPAPGEVVAISAEVQSPGVSSTNMVGVQTSALAKPSGDDQEATEVGTQDDGPTEESRRLTCDEANQRAMEIAKADPDFAKNPNARAWAEKIGCSVGLVIKLPFWQSTMVKTGRGRGKSHSARPKVKTLTSDVEEIETASPVPRAKDAEKALDQLIDEQAKDDKSDRCAKQL